MVQSSFVKACRDSREVPAPRKDVAVHVEATFSLGMVGGARTFSPRKCDKGKYLGFCTNFLCHNALVHTQKLQYIIQLQ